MAVIASAGIVATGCGDSGGLQSARTDGGASDAAASLGGQAGSTSAMGGTAGTPDTGGVAGTKGTGVTGGSVDTGGAAGTKGSGGVAGSGGMVGSGGAKGGSDGGADAAVDVSTSDRGGTVDGAADAGAKDGSASETPALPDSSVASDGAVVCGPVCLMYCAYGNVLDENGCELCACNSPPPCPGMKCQACTYGYVRDTNGCLTCTCAPGPSVPCSQIPDLRVCEASTHCRWLTPGCAMGGNPLAESESGCYEQVDCFTTSDCSETGSTCVDRTVAPPGGPGGDWCGMTVRICL
jgi:hypothetical protein